ncbi:MAG: DUF4349 domain-containing protein [Patescibacteria group bacterium]
MQNVISWLKHHKLVVALVVIVLFFLLKDTSKVLPVNVSSNRMESAGVAMSDSFAAPSTMKYAPPIVQSAQSVDMTASDRKVVKNSDLSLLVKDVRSSIDQITQFATNAGGFMVNSSVLTPEEGGSGNVSIRVPADKLENALQFLRGLSVRVVSENVTGFDVTDQFTDTQARLNTLTKTKATFEAMLDKANTVDDILRVQQSILQVQDQIDSLKGQLQYLEKTSQSSLITIYLSTDELALPYSPNEPWRPSVIFKTAVRSLVANLRQVGSAGIWVGVYSPILLIIGAIILVVRKKMN